MLSKEGGKNGGRREVGLVEVLRPPNIQLYLYIFTIIRHRTPHAQRSNPTEESGAWSVNLMFAGCVVWCELHVCLGWVQWGRGRCLLWDPTKSMNSKSKRVGRGENSTYSCACLVIV